MWLAPEAIATQTPHRSGKRGGQRRYSDLAIESVLGCEILNRMTALGRPASYRIGR
jgi:hypothetical protein